ncbi:nucleoside hydrolase [Hydrogenophaga sp.]|uniref:nucleoside hydrolase n=1 Tax=Hydrogenophaga sp. TaxID=1904254 RepID=UPI002720E44C|nr:nucleoside hydrolase [Hydrogenophaga sp.]MDO8905362.1 nucleoside hydrolase [Hydrogenophaga sp.]
MKTASHRSTTWYQQRLAPPAGPVRVVIDTDAANEIDDQFAIAWAMCRPDRLRVAGLYAAPFSFAHRRSILPLASADDPAFAPPGVGMARSFDEIHRVLDLLGDPVSVAAKAQVCRGSEGYLSGPGQPLHSAAVDHLIATAREHAADGPPLYVMALGCVTNIASALMLAPDLIDRIVVVWTSGYPSHAPWPNTSLNLEQDLWASQWLFDCGVPLVYLPGYHVGAQLRLSLPEMQRHVQGRGAIGDELYRLYTHNPLWAILGQTGAEPYSWVIWDIICVAWLLNPDWVPSGLVDTPRLGDDLRWLADATSLPMREAYAVQRDAIFSAFFAQALGDGGS